MPAQTKPLVLASASPRRREILQQLGLRFEVIESAVPEPERERELPEAYASGLAALKAEAVAERLARQSAATHDGAFVLGADTIVVVDERVLGKPRDDAHAREMVGMLAGRFHEVITAVALGRWYGLAKSIAVHTRVAFRALTRTRSGATWRPGKGATRRVLCNSRRRHRHRARDRGLALERRRPTGERDAGLTQRSGRARELAMTEVWIARVQRGLEATRARIASACAHAKRDPASVRLIAVSKKQPPEAIAAAYALGQREFGENYVQELAAKTSALGDLGGARFRLIGHLQKNKAKDAARLGCAVDTVDSVELADQLDKRAQLAGSSSRC